MTQQSFYVKPPLMDSQTVSIKSALNPTEFKELTLIGIRSKPSWPGALGHFVVNGTCLYAGPRPTRDQTFTMMSSDDSNHILRFIQESFPQLSYLDFSMIYRHLSENNETTLFKNLYPEDFFDHFHLKWSMDLQNLFLTLLSLAEPVQNSIHDKRWQWGDLQIFLSLKGEELTKSPHFEKLFSLHLSKSEMVQSCELLIECLLLQTPLDSSNWTVMNVKDSLRACRFPNHRLEKSIQNPLKNVQIKAIRQNDRQGYEFKFFSASAAEFDKVIQKIQNSEMDWSS